MANLLKSHSNEAAEGHATAADHLEDQCPRSLDTAVGYYHTGPGCGPGFLVVILL